MVSVVSNCLQTVACQTPLSMGFSWQEYWSGFLYLLQGIFLTQGSNPDFLCLLRWQVGSLPLVPPDRLLNICILSSVSDHIQFSSHLGASGIQELSKHQFLAWEEVLGGPDPVL